MASPADRTCTPSIDSLVPTGDRTAWRGDAIPAGPGTGGVATPVEAASLIRETMAARAALRAAAAADQARLLAEHLDDALASLNAAYPPSGPAPAPIAVSPAGPAWLSPREREVLALVAEGHTNKDIAGALFLSPNTVKSHITSLLHKLRVDSRVRLAAIAIEHGLHQRTAPDGRVSPARRPSTVSSG